MFKTTYERVEDCNLHDVVLHNFKVTSRLHDLDIVVNLADAWVSINKDKKVTDLEDYFRANDIDVHLIATVYNDDKYEPRSLFDITKSVEYKLIFSCKTDEDAIQELKTHWSDYNENYSKLNDSGAMVPKGSNLTMADVEKAREGDDVISLMKSNRIKLYVERVTDAEMQQELLEQLTNDSEMAKSQGIEKPEQVLIGMAHDGSPVFGFRAKHNGQEGYISSVGLSMGYDNSGEQKMRYVLINDKSTWEPFMDTTE